jgi:hypothetical protein
LGFTNPRTGRGEGWLGEGKRHDGPRRYTTAMLSGELHRLREKIAKLDNHGTYGHAIVGKHVTLAG